MMGRTYTMQLALFSTFYHGSVEQAQGIAAGHEGMLEPIVAAMWRKRNRLQGEGRIGERGQMDRQAQDGQTLWVVRGRARVFHCQADRAMCC